MFISFVLKQKKQNHAVAAKEKFKKVQSFPAMSPHTHR
jgi:hypothetical protein